MTQVLSHARKITCAGVRRMRGFDVVFTPPVAYKGIAIACKRNTLTLGLQEKLSFTQLDVCDREEDCHHEVAIPRKRSLLMDSTKTTSSPSWGRHAQSLHRARRMVDLVAVEFAPWDEVLG